MAIDKEVGKQILSAWGLLLLSFVAFSQTEEVKEAVKRAWDISPDTVYGALVAFLLLMLIASIFTAVYFYKLAQKNQREFMLKIEEARKDYTEAISELSNKIAADTQVKERLIIFFEQILRK